MPTDTGSRIAAKQGFGVPNRIGSLNFCPTCGNLLDVPKDDDVITCAQCGHTEDAVRKPCLSFTSRFHAMNHADRAFIHILTACLAHNTIYLWYLVYSASFDELYTEYENISITTRSHPDAFPSILKDRRSVVKSLADNKDLQDDMTKKQEIEEKCPDCGQWVLHIIET